jgi:hypothetical protein
MAQSNDRRGGLAGAELGQAGGVRRRGHPRLMAEKD